MPRGAPPHGCVEPLYEWPSDTVGHFRKGVFVRYCGLRRMPRTKLCSIHAWVRRSGRRLERQ